MKEWIFPHLHKEDFSIKISIDDGSCLLVESLTDLGKTFNLKDHIQFTKELSLSFCSFILEELAPYQDLIFDQHSLVNSSKVPKDYKSKKWQLRSELKDDEMSFLIPKGESSDGVYTRQIICGSLLKKSIEEIKEIIIFREQQKEQNKDKYFKTLETF